jgi:hypothetical protein
MVTENVLKVCSCCKIEKQLSLFNIDKKAKHGRRCYCKSCEKEKREAVKEYHKLRQLNWRRKNADKHKMDVRFLSYKKQGLNISRKEYLDLYQAQEGKCALCGKSEEENGKALCLDHCHKSILVRGFLCTDCNIGLGKFKDNVDVLFRAVEYLTKYEKLAASKN